MESRIAEIDGDSDTLLCWHGDEDGKRIILDRKSLDLGPGSSLSELGFCAAREDETTPVEDEASLTFLGMTDDRLGVSDEGEAMPMDKASNLTENGGDLVRRPKLGFGGAPMTTNNGGRREGSFNMAEFIKLAHIVIDAEDHDSLTALEELKTKWETRFGKEATAKSFPATTTLTEPPLVRGMCQALRNNFPSVLGEKSIENRAAVRTRILPVRMHITGDISGRTAAEKMNGGAGSGSVNVPTRSTEIRPVIHGEGAFPSHSNEEKSAAATADVGTDSAADVGADYAAYVGDDSDDDITADLCDDISAAGKKKELQYWIQKMEGHGRGLVYGKTAILLPLEGVCTFGSAGTSRGTANCIAKMETGHAMRKMKHTQVPVWKKLRHLPMEFWMTEGLSIVASGVGKPLYPDAITRACTRLDFARVCVMIDITQKLQKHIITITPDEDGGETPCKIDIEYEWLPPKCTGCMTLGHSVKECTSTKPPKQTKPPVNDVTRGDDGVEHDKCETSYHKEKGKEKRLLGVLTHAAPLVVSMLNLAVWNVRGLNKRDHQLAVTFYGILETRVRFNNVMHIRSFLLPHWKWFVDYASVGNRIWVAWDENVVDVHIIELGNQFLHFRVTNRADNESLNITVVYGASEMIDRRSLWTTLETLAREQTDDPWLVGGISMQSEK
ncbi:UNVERIFIED_CONTAM: hypothetical protein Sindi_3021000 [Sesamum indicum]